MPEIMQLQGALWGTSNLGNKNRVSVNLERLLCKSVLGPNIWLLLITFCPCFIPSHLLLLGPEFSPSSQGWMISKIRLSLFPQCRGPGHGQDSFSTEKSVGHFLSHPQSLSPSYFAQHHLQETDAVSSVKEEGALILDSDWSFKSQLCFFPDKNTCLRRCLWGLQKIKQQHCIMVKGRPWHPLATY